MQYALQNNRRSNTTTSKTIMICKNMNNLLSCIRRAVHYSVPSPDKQSPSSIHAEQGAFWVA